MLLLKSLPLLVERVSLCSLQIIALNLVCQFRYCYNIFPCCYGTLVTCSVWPGLTVTCFNRTWPDLAWPDLNWPDLTWPKFVSWLDKIFLFLNLQCFHCRSGLRSTFNMAYDLDLYQIIFMLMSAAPFWFGVMIFILIALLPDIIGMALCRYYIPTDIQKTQVCYELIYSPETGILLTNLPFSCLKTFFEWNRCGMSENMNFYVQWETDVFNYRGASNNVFILIL